VVSVAQSPPGPSTVIWRVITVSLNPVEQRGHVDRGLLALRSLGFQFATNRDSGGVIVTVTGFRPHHGVIDIVQLYGEHDADAIRVPGDEPDVLFPRTTIWRTTGAAKDVIDNLLALPDPAIEERTTSSTRLRAGLRAVSSAAKRIRLYSPYRRTRRKP
jgi:hypothetical protein